MNITDLTALKINVLTKAQYDAAEKNANEIYLVTDDAVTIADVVGLQDALNGAKAYTDQAYNNAVNHTNASIIGVGNQIDATYEKKTDAQAKLDEAKRYAESLVGAADTLLGTGEVTV